MPTDATYVNDGAFGISFERWTWCPHALVARCHQQMDDSRTRETPKPRFVGNTLEFDPGQEMFKARPLVSERLESRGANGK